MKESLEMNVLSVFNGMSCGRLALERAGIKVDKYYSSEIDKYAIQIADNNYPEDIPHKLGDVTKWREWDIDWSSIDLIIAGSPCQGFSVAGKQLNFEDPRSKLFFEFVDILNVIKIYNPNVKFMLENVNMKQEYKDIITGYMGVEPIMINSALVSAQRRKRWHWTNIPNVEQPEDKGILLQDIVFDDALVDRQKSHAIIGSIGRTTTREYFKKHQGQLVYDVTMLSNVYGGFKEKTPRIHNDGKSVTIRTAKDGGHIPLLVTSNLFLTKKALEYTDRKVANGRTRWNFGHHSDVRNSKSATVVANFFKGVPYNVIKDWNCTRKVHPVECERLQTLPDGYTEGVSNTQRYKMLGNGWTVDVIAHIFKGLKGGTMKLEIIERQIKELEEAKVEMLQNYKKDNNLKKLITTGGELHNEEVRLKESKRLEEKRISDISEEMAMEVYLHSEEYFMGGEY